MKYAYRIDTPEISSISNGTSGISLKWNKTVGASGYFIYRSVDGQPYSKVQTTKALNYTDTTANVSCKKYSYKIVAYRVIDGVTYKSNSSSTKIMYRLTSVSMNSIKNATSKAFTIRWTKSNSISGYYIQYSTSGSFSDATNVNITSNATTGKNVTNLTKGKLYYVRMRSYKTVNGIKYYSGWSERKTVKIMK